MKLWLTILLLTQLARAAFGAPAGGPLTLELQSEAAVPGTEATLAQVCRWPAEQSGDLAPFSSTVVARAQRGGQFAPLDLIQLRGMLESAGMNLAFVQFSGASRCVVRQDSAAPAPAAASAPAIAPMPAMVPAQPVRASAEPARPAAAELPRVSPAATSVTPSQLLGSSRTLRELLVEELCNRCRVNPDILQVDFAANAAAYLELQEAENAFVITARHSGLGAQSWDVQLTRSGKTERVTLTATARAWENRITLLQPVAARQMIRSSDVEQKKVLSERLTPDLLTNPVQVVGQLAARDLRPGTVFTSYLVSPVPLVQAGQTVNLRARTGAVQVTTVAKAIDSGTFGQVVKVRNEATKTVLEAKVTGPQTVEMN